MVCFVAAASAILLFRMAPDFQLLFLDVGQGDCILIRSGSHVFLTDCGSSSITEIWSRRVCSALKYYGISSVDAIFVTHGDNDHMNGIKQMLENGRKCLNGVCFDGIYVGSLITFKGAASEDRDETLFSLSGTASKAGCAVTEINEGEMIRTGDLSIACLYPDALEEEPEQQDAKQKEPEQQDAKQEEPEQQDAKQEEPQQQDAKQEDTGMQKTKQLVTESVSANTEEYDTNQHSMVLLVKYCDFTALLTGDLEKDAENALAAKLRKEPVYQSWTQNQGLTVLKCGHHGSRNASQEALLGVTEPAYAVISCGLNNRYGHPAQVVLERLSDTACEVFRTDLQGAVSFCTDDTGVVTVQTDH